MGRAEEVEALCGQLEPGSSYAVLDAAIAALREYATLLRDDAQLTGHYNVEMAKLHAENALLRDTRPRFSGGARSQEDEDRCAPLVEAIQQAHEAHELALWEDTTYWLSEGMKRIDALRAHRERGGATDGN